MIRKMSSPAAVFVIVPLALFLCSCSPRMLSSSLEYSEEPANLIGNDCALITKCYFPPENDSWIQSSNVNSLKTAVKNAVQSSGRFRKVFLKKMDRNAHPDCPQPVQMEITIKPVDEGKFSWAVAWPAVYPMCLYWPIQPRRGNAKVEMDVLLKQGMSRESFTVDATRPYDVYFYGFFRVGKIEEALMECYNECLSRLSARLGATAWGDSSRPQVETRVLQQTGLNVALLDLESDVLSVSERSALTNKLRSELMGTGAFRVMERSQMEAILKEQGFQQTGCTNEACVIEVGQLIGVEQMVACHIGKVGGLIGLGGTWLISLRIIDVAHGDVLASVDVEQDGSIADIAREGLRKISEKLSKNIRK